MACRPYVLHTHQATSKNPLAASADRVGLPPTSICSFFCLTRLAPTDGVHGDNDSGRDDYPIAWLPGPYAIDEQLPPTADADHTLGAKKLAHNLLSEPLVSLPWDLPLNDVLHLEAHHRDISAPLELVVAKSHKEGGSLGLYLRTHG